MKCAILMAVLLLSAVPATAADKWTRVQSKNFTLAGNASENQIREVAEQLEVFRTAFSRFFNLKEGSSVGTTVIVFKSDSAFKPYKPLYQGKPANVEGYFQPGSDMNFIALAADMQTPRVIYHELVHRIMSDNMGSLPLWFQEGFAECFSSIEIMGKDKKVRLGRALAEHVELLNERRFMPLEKLFAVAHGSPEYNEAEKQGLFYAESWAFVHYMMFATPERRTQFMTFLNGLSSGSPAPQVFQEVFKTDLASFQKTFEAYIQQRMAWNAFEMNTAGGLDRSKDMAALTLSEAESEFYLGDLLRHTNRLPEAQTHLAKAIQLDATLGAAHASMGRLLMAKNNDAEALGYLKRATELEPGNYLTHYYYASLIGSRKNTLSDAEWTTMRTELQKTIELAPHFIEATEMLAAANISRNTDIPQTAELLANALKVAPGRDYLAVQLAYALSRTQQRESARPLLRSILAKPSLDPVLRQNAQNLIDFLDRSLSVPAGNTNRAAVERVSINSTLTPVTSNTDDAEAPESRRTVSTPNATPPAPEFTREERDRLQRELDALAPGTAKMRGLLTLLDCRNGLTLSLVADGKTVKFHSATPNAIKFTSFNSAVTGQIACGPTPGNGVPAAIVYRPQPTAEVLGEPLNVEFLDTADRSLYTALPTVPGTSLVKGLLTKLDCTGSVSISVVFEGKTLQFYTDSTSKVAFMNGPNPDGTVTCGPIAAPGLPVTVLYRPAASGNIMGEPVIVQFQK
jgi:tetratricopeptide (TPR) repeat protein